LNDAALGQRRHLAGPADLGIVAPKLDPRLLSLAFVFLLVGYGTKVGLAPFHAWLLSNARDLYLYGYAGADEVPELETVFVSLSARATRTTTFTMSCTTSSGFSSKQPSSKPISTSTMKEADIRSRNDLSRWRW
jgi:hypothetical protein